MGFKPSIIAWDVETALLDGTPSVEFYRDDFRVTDAAFAWEDERGQIQTQYTKGEDATRRVLERIKVEGIPTVVHNVGFEYGVTLCRFPGLEEVITYDTMRLVQVGDNGGAQAQRDYENSLFDGDGDEETKVTSGLGLVSACSRWLKDYKNHKQQAYEWLRAQGVPVKQEGSNLHRLPADLMRTYNVGDAIATLKLYKTLTEEFRIIEYDWSLDHALYIAIAKRIAARKRAGVAVDRETLQANLMEAETAFSKIGETFRQRFLPQIEEIEAVRADAYVLGVKTLAGQQKRRERLKTDDSPIRFNPNSAAQLAELFLDKLGMTATFYTVESKQAVAKRKKDPSLPEYVPSPSFKAAHLHTYGEGGTILAGKGTLRQSISQMKNLLALSEYDGRWHIDLMAAGTVTGRFKGKNNE